MTQTFFYAIQLAIAVTLGLGAFGIGCDIAFAAEPVMSGHSRAASATPLATFVASRDKPYGALIGDATNRTPLMWGYILGAAIMIFGGIVAWYFGIDAEGQSLEDIADPLSKVSEEASS